MAQQSPFENEWRRCLREHYKYVIRKQDGVTERSLTTVLHRVGFDDEELNQLYVQATMRQDEMADGFVPDINRMTQPHPAECACGICKPQDEAAFDAMLETGHDDEGQPLVLEEAPVVSVPEAAGNLFVGVDLTVTSDVDDSIEVDAEEADPEIVLEEDIQEDTDEADVVDDDGDDEDENMRQMSMF